MTTKRERLFSSKRKTKGREENPSPHGDVDERKKTVKDIESTW